MRASFASRAADRVLKLKASNKALKQMTVQDPGAAEVEQLKDAMQRFTEEVQRESAAARA